MWHIFELHLERCSEL